MRTTPAQAPTIAPTTKRLSARTATPPNKAVRRRTSFPRTSADNDLSFILPKRDGKIRKSERRSAPVVEARRALAARQSHLLRVGRSPRPMRRKGRERRRRNDVPREYVALRGRQVGSDGPVGAGHSAEHRLHGGRMLFHPLQPLSGIDRAPLRSVLGAGAVKLPDPRAHRACDSAPRVLLAGFGG